MFRTERISSDRTLTSKRSLRSSLADSAWSAQDRARTGLENQLADFGLSGRALAIAAMVLVAAGLGVAGLLWAAPDGGGTAAQATRLALEQAPAPAAAVPAKPDPGPTLHGAPPDFEAAPGDSGRIGSAHEIEAAASGDKAAAPAASAHPSTATTFSTASSAAADSAAAGPVAGPAAIGVAREFAGAFVRYETGDDGDAVRKAFGKTAAQPLAKALLRRPPRLPAHVKVPQARVLNIVPGPSHGGVYTISVSLLRVGVTSELRLDMQQQGNRKDKSWRVTNVLG